MTIGLYQLILFGLWIGCVVWLVWCAASAGRGTAARVVCGIFGVVLYPLNTYLVTEVLFKDLVRKLLAEFADGAVLTGGEVVSTSIVLVFGLGLRSLLKEPKAAMSTGREAVQPSPDCTEEGRGQSRSSH